MIVFTKNYVISIFHLQVNPFTHSTMSAPSGTAYFMGIQDKIELLVTFYEFNFSR